MIFLNIFLEMKQLLFSFLQSAKGSLYLEFPNKPKE